jgi:polysaccharide pyruvyl transferase WcaK-like protein
MRIHHFYPRTQNIGDHFVQRGIERMFREVDPDASFKLFNVNNRGADRSEYGLTRQAIARANQEADLIVIGGSNLYEGGYRWPWGVQLEVAALAQLRVPLFLLGIGTGSNFGASVHRPSPRARREIKSLNDQAAFSGVRDVTTLAWLQQLGVTKAKLAGDPATFIFNQPFKPNSEGALVVVVPPRRFWSSKRNFWRVHTRGRALFRSLVEMVQEQRVAGREVRVVCNDPLDLSVAQELFGEGLPGAVVCPQTPEAYFAILQPARAVVSARLHTAVVAFSLGIPFLLFDVDQRTHGFIKTYGLERWSVDAATPNVDTRLREGMSQLLNAGASDLWRELIEQRDSMRAEGRNLLYAALINSGALRRVV